MFQFIFCGLLAAFFAYISHIKGNKHYLILSFCVIAYIMGLQDAVAIDFPGYEKNFELIMLGQKSYGFLSIEGRHSEGEIEIGWYFLNRVLGSIIHSYHFVTLVACIFMCCIMYKMLQKVDSKWNWLSILYFYLVSMQFCMSGIRQALAMMCFMMAAINVIERKWKHLILFSLLGMSFHNSYIVVLCALPLLLIPDDFIEKYIKKVIFICIVAYLLVLLNSSSIRSILIQEFMSTMTENAGEYDHYFESILEAKSSFLNMAFRFLNFIFIVIAFYYAKAKERKLMLFFLIAAYTIAVVGENSPLARINNYFTIFSIPAICIIPSVPKNKALCNAFVILTIIYIIKTTIDHANSYLYIGYLDFHTIIF